MEQNNVIDGGASEELFSDAPVEKTTDDKPPVENVIDDGIIIPSNNEPPADEIPADDAPADDTPEGEDNQDDLPLIVDIQNKIGISFKGEDGKDVVYEDTPEDLTRYVADVIAHKEEEIVEKAKTSFLNAIPPDVKDYYNHRAAGKDPESFFANPLKDIQNVVMQEDDVELQKNIVKLRLNITGFDSAYADKVIKGLEAGNVLYETAKSDLPFLQNKDKEDKQANEAFIQQQVKANEEREQKFVSAINETIQKGIIQNIEIPLKDKEPFKKYFTEPTQDGRTQYEIEVADNIEVLMRDAYIQFKKGNFKDIIAKELGKAKVVTMKDRINKVSDKTHMSSFKSTDKDFDMD